MRCEECGLPRNRFCVSAASDFGSDAESVSDVHNRNQIQNNCHLHPKLGHNVDNKSKSRHNVDNKPKSKHSVDNIQKSTYSPFRILTSSFSNFPSFLASLYFCSIIFGQVDWNDLEQLHYIHEDVNSDVTPKSLKFTTCGCFSTNWRHKKEVK